MVQAYETWHCVDVPTVVCPKLEGMDFETGKYAVSIDYDAEKDEGMQVDAPHINITFYRASGKEAKLRFRVVDANGEEVVEETEVLLEATGPVDGGHEECVHSGCDSRIS